MASQPGSYPDGSPSGRRFIYPLGEEGNDGVLITEQPVGRILDEDTDNGDTPVKGGLLLI